MSTVVVIADREKLQAVLAERGLPTKLGAKLTATEQKVHNLLCAAYNFRTATVVLEVPPNILNRCGVEFRKVWAVQPLARNAQGKLETAFTLTSEAIKTTIRTGMTKDTGIFKAKTNQVQLHETWTRYFKPKKQEKQSIDWSKEERAAKRRHEAIKSDILDGKTFNAQKDNPWARKHLKNKGA